MGRFHSGNTTVRFEDSAGVGLTIGPGPGDLSVDNIEYNNKERVQKFDRSSHDGWVETVDKTQSCSISIELQNQTITDAAAARVHDFIVNKTLAGAALSSVSPDTWAWKTIVTMNDGVTTATCTLPECVGGEAFAEAAEGHTISVAFLNALAPVWA